RRPSSTLFPYTTLFRSEARRTEHAVILPHLLPSKATHLDSGGFEMRPRRSNQARSLTSHNEHNPRASARPPSPAVPVPDDEHGRDRKSTRLNSSHVSIS